MPQSRAAKSNSNVALLNTVHYQGDFVIFHVICLRL